MKEFILIMIILDGSGEGGIENLGDIEFDEIPKSLYDKLKKLKKG